MTNWYDVLERACWTFVQGSLGALTTVPLITDIAGWEAGRVAALSGGIAALISMLKTLAQERLEVVPETRANKK